MKGNRKIRLTVILVALALVTSVFAVGTLSKYSIGGGANDTARVAKWGVTIDIEGQNSFATSSSDGAIVSSNTDKVVAPGTNSVEADGLMAVTLKGNPEVDFQLIIDLEPLEDVFLAKDVVFPDYTEATVDGVRGSFDFDKTYYPVVFTFTHYYNPSAAGSFSLKPAAAGTGLDVTDPVDVTGDYAKKEVFTGTLAEMDAFFANVSTAMEHVQQHYVLDDRFELTWAWDFGDPANNQKDTMLGNLAAGLTENYAGTADYVDGTDYNLELEYNFSIVIKQLDDGN